MIKLMIIPCLDEPEESVALAREYKCTFEYNDFTSGDILDNEKKVNQIYEKIIKMPSRTCSNVHGAFYDISIFSSDRLIRRVSEYRVRQSMYIASKIGCRGVVFHTNYIPTFRQEAYEKSWVKQNKEFWLKIAKEYPKTIVYMENMFDLEPDLLLELAREMKNCNNFSICLDIAHAHISNVPAEIWIEKFADYIGHIHINDNDKISDGHLPFGEGTMNYYKIFNAISEYCPNVTMLIEVSGIDNQKKCFDYLAGNFPDMLQGGK